MTDRPDDAMSSEELIRRAREGLDRAAPLPDDLPLIDEGREAPPERAAEPSSAPSPESFPAPLPEAPDPFRGEHTIEDDTSLLPEHFRPEQAPARPSGFNFNVLRWVIPIGVVAYVLFNFITADTAVDDLTIGDCFMNPTEIEITTVETVECSEPHDYEVFAFVELAERSGDFPGDNALFDEAGEKCFDRFLAYTGLNLESEFTDYLYDVFIPDRASWEDGNRESMCAVYAVDGGFNPITSRGSARAD